MVVLCGCSLNLVVHFKLAMRDVCAFDAIKVLLCTAGNG